MSHNKIPGTWCTGGGYLPRPGDQLSPTPRSPSLATAPLLSPGTPRPAVWGGRGTVARPRGGGWRSGAASDKKAVLKQT